MKAKKKKKVIITGTGEITCLSEIRGVSFSIVIVPMVVNFKEITTVPAKKRSHSFIALLALSI